MQYCLNLVRQLDILDYNIGGGTMIRESIYNILEKVQDISHTFLQNNTEVFN